VETKAGKVRITEIKRRRKKKRTGKETRRKRENKKEKEKETKKDRNVEGSKRIGDLG